MFAFISPSLEVSAICRGEISELSPILKRLLSFINPTMGEGRLQVRITRFVFVQGLAVRVNVLKFIAMFYDVLTMKVNKNHVVNTRFDGIRKRNNG